VSPPAAACVVIFATVVKDQYKDPYYLLFPALVGSVWMYMVQYSMAVLSRSLAGPAK